MANTPRLVVREVSRGRHWLLVIAATVVFGCASYGVYLLLRAQLPYDWEQVEIERERTTSQRAELNREISRLRDENARQAEKIVMLERGVDIDRESGVELQTALRDLQGELEAQKEQLAFYRGIVSPDESRAGMRIYEVTVMPVEGKPRHYSFDLMLIQAVRHNRRVTGKVDMAIRGVRDGEETSLSAEQLGIRGVGKMSYSFRYFQELSGSFALPEGFAPTAVVLTVSSGGTDGNGFEKQFPWNEVHQSTGA